MNHDLPDEWTVQQVKVYTRLVRLMVENQSLYMHPDAAEVSAEHWAKTAHNAAWHAAELMELDDNTLLAVCDADTGEELGCEREATH